MITNYHNGTPYNIPYQNKKLQSFTKNKSQIIFDLQHFPINKNKILRKHIHQTQLYNRTLSTKKITTSTKTNNHYINNKKIVTTLNNEQLTIRNTLIDHHNQLLQHQKVLTKKNQQKIYTITTTNPIMTQLLPHKDTMTTNPIMTPNTIATIIKINSDFNLTPNSSNTDHQHHLTT